LVLNKLELQRSLGFHNWYQSFALRNFDLEDMEFESTNSGTTAKLPILKLGEYEMWVIRIKQYFQIQDYALWEVIENVTAEEKTNKKNDVKARSLLLIALPNEHQLTFSQYPDAKLMFAAIKTRFREDLNSKLLSSLPPEWNTHVVVWMNKPEVETMSIDDLYNNFKIVEQKVKKSVGASSGAQNLAFMTAPSTSSTNDANTASLQVSTASPNVNAASLQVSTASVSDNAVYAFLVENPNGSNVPHQDLEQIHEDDLEAIDLKWECRAPRSKEGQFRNQDNTRKQINNEDKSLKAMLAIDGVDFDWSDIIEEQVQTNIALMAFSDSKVYTDKTCSKTCLKNYETLKKQCDDLIVNLNQTEFIAATYKKVLKSEVACKDYEINVLKSEFEKVKQEKDGIEFKIEKFEKASKDLDQLLGSQITDKSKKGLGYSAVPPPHPLIYNRPKKLDLSYSGLDEFKEPEFKGYGPKNSKQESNVFCDKKPDNSKENSKESLVEEQVSQDTSSFVESSPNINCDNHKRKGIVSRNNYNRVDAKTTHPSVHRNMSPRAVLLKTGLTPLNTVRPVNTAHHKSAVHSAKSNTVRVKGVNAVKTSACWVWRPTKPNGASLAFKRHNYIDARGRSNGCSRYMTGNIAYLSDFKEFDGGYVAFRGKEWMEGYVISEVGDEAVHKELGDRMERAATTASSLEAEQDSGSGPRCQDTILGDVDAQTRFEITSKQSNDLPLSRGYILRSGEDSMKLLEFIELCSVNAVRHMLMLPFQVPVVVGDFINTSIQESDGFVEVIDFLKASSVHYALTVNPTIYTSCIEQFWATANVQTVNGVRQLQALVDKKRSSLRSQAFDVIFTWKMHKLGDMSHHKKIFVNPFHTKKVFANMKRAGKDFSGRITPLFDTMMVQASEEAGEDSDHPTDSNQIPIIDQPSTSSQPKQKQKSKRRQRKEAEVPQDET
ncbi:hypothetical protein Tco_0369564, partial [Tanacetum coccineum]